MKEEMEKIKLNANFLMACQYARFPEKKLSTRIINDADEKRDNEYVLFVTMLGDDEVSVLIESSNDISTMPIPAVITYNDKEYKVTKLYGYNPNDSYPNYIVPKYTKEIETYGRAFYQVVNENEYLQCNGQSIMSMDGKIFYLDPNWERNDQNIDDKSQLMDFMHSKGKKPVKIADGVELMPGAVWVDEWKDGKVVLPSGIKVIHSKAIQGDKVSINILDAFK